MSKRKSLAENIELIGGRIAYEKLTEFRSDHLPWKMLSPAVRNRWAQWAELFNADVIVKWPGLAIRWIRELNHAVN